MSNDQVYIHIGYPKSASTTLQLNLFDKHPDLNYLGPKSLQNRANTKIIEFWDNINKLNGIEYNQDRQLDLYKQCIQPYLNLKKINVFGHEGMLNSRYGDNTLKAYRIKNFFVDAKIIIILRNQIEAIRSLYEMMPFSPVGAYGSEKYLSFDSWLEKSFQSSQCLQRSFLIGLKYYEHIKLYSSLFGDRNIGVFLFEELVNSPDIFAKKISDFMQIDYSQSLSLLKSKSKQNSAKIHSVYNLKRKLIPSISIRSILPLEIHKYLIEKLTNAIPYTKTQWNKKYLNQVFNLYRESNQKLVDDLKLEVDKFNYPM